ERGCPRRAGEAARQGVRILGMQPCIGRLVDDLPEAFREWPIDFGSSGYVVGDDVVTVLAIRHQKESGNGRHRPVPSWRHCPMGHRLSRADHHSELSMKKPRSRGAFLFRICNHQLRALSTILPLEIHGIMPRSFSPTLSIWCSSLMRRVAMNIGLPTAFSCM